jgi:hypothetical protein
VILAVFLFPVFVDPINRSICLFPTKSTGNFWNRGLQMAWGDPQLVTDSDALRFAWPSVGVGWERGLLSFARAQARPPVLDDAALFQRVVQLPNTTVKIIVGSKDRVVSPAMVRRFVQRQQSSLSSGTISSSSNNNNDDSNGKNGPSSTPQQQAAMVNIHEMKGLGHDPFEENVDGFVELVEQYAKEFLSQQQEQRSRQQTPFQ